MTVKKAENTNFMKNVVIVMLVLLALGVFAYIAKDFYADGVPIYSSKEKLCQDFAQSYLKYYSKNVQVNSKVWSQVIDVETNLYNTCISNPSESMK